MIDAELQKKLRNKFNPDGSEMRQSQLKMLDILNVVDEICRRNNIEYWIGSGTLIGAVRHGGFIPWDDDIDIEILYSDRKRFIEACLRELPDKYKLQCNLTDNTYFLNILKVRELDSDIKEYAEWGNNRYLIKGKYNGYFIDIFTIEKTTRPIIWITRAVIRVAKIAQYKCKLSPNKLSVLNKIYNFIYSILRLLVKLNPFTKYYYHSLGSWFMSRRVYSEIFPTTEIEFEGKLYKAPRDYDAYLRRIYGDYMTLPSEDKRLPLHNEDLLSSIDSNK